MGDVSSTFSHFFFIFCSSCLFAGLCMRCRLIIIVVRIKVKRGLMRGNVWSAFSHCFSFSVHRLYHRFLPYYCTMCLAHLPFHGQRKMDFSFTGINGKSVFVRRYRSHPTTFSKSPGMTGKCWNVCDLVVDFLPATLPH